MLTTDSPAGNGTATARKNGRAANGFAHLENWVFDLDNTLYPAACNLFAQVDVKIGQFVADLLKIGMDEAVRIQKEYFRTYGTSLRGLMLHHQVDPDAFLDFVHRDRRDADPALPGAGPGAGAAAGAQDHLHQRLATSTPRTSSTGWASASSSRRSSTSRRPTSCRSPIPSSMR